MNRPGALAERLVVASDFAWAAPDVPVTDLVCVEPATVARAALRRLRAAHPPSALVVGVGAQGLTMALTLLHDDTSVYVSDINQKRVEFATELGARSVPDDASFDLVVDTVGVPSSMSLAVEHVSVGGSILCLGLDSRPLQLTSQVLVRSQISVQGSLTYDHPDDFEATLSLVAAGHFQPGRIVTDEYELEEAQKAFDRSGDARGKTWINVASTN